MKSKNISYDHNGNSNGNCHAPVLPMSRKGMDDLGWECCDIIIVTGDAYVDHPSFGMALIGRVLESEGFRVGIISQPDWHSKAAFMALGKPRLMFGVSAGNMDSMVNRYTANQRIRSDDAYTPGNLPGKRPDRSVIVYSQRCREAYPGIPIVIGGIEASLRRVAHYDYWSDKIRRSIVLDSKADILVYGNGEKQIVAIADRLAKDEPIKQITDLRGTAFPSKEIPGQWKELNFAEIKDRKQSKQHDNRTVKCDNNLITTCRNSDHAHTIVRLPSYEQVSQDKTLFALAGRILHIDYNNSSSGCAFVQQHGDRDVMINPPSPPLTTKELDKVYELPFTRQPHPAYGKNRIPAYEMIRFSVTII
ncbi:MAG: YgiQ family radical SAM protein, partial [Candidatus Anammoxibacter sp.]